MTSLAVLPNGSAVGVKAYALVDAMFLHCSFQTSSQDKTTVRHSLQRRKRRWTLAESCGNFSSEWPERKKNSYSFSESHWCTESTCQGLIEWLGTWVRKQGFLHWVLLWDCASVHRLPSLMEWVRVAHPECHVLFVPCGYTAELQPADNSIQQPLKHIIKQQAVQFFAESVCRKDAVGDLRLSTMKRLMARWVLHACTEVEKHEHHNEGLAPPLVNIRRGTTACGALHPRVPPWDTL